jgi:hypothetical protein
MTGCYNSCCIFCYTYNDVDTGCLKTEFCLQCLDLREKSDGKQHTIVQ